MARLLALIVAMGLVLGAIALLGSMGGQPLLGAWSEPADAIAQP